MADDATPRAVVRAAEVPGDTPPWGRLQWMAGAAVNGCETLTVGAVSIKPGEANPLHLHPNCDEVLLLVAGQVDHRLGDEWIAMTAGDAIHIPCGVPHCARNSGATEARMVVSFNSGRRETVVLDGGSLG
ncbi:MAG: cupin domain-containing protein [Fimbriimonadaceae bacterium]|nr:cupin domain-containing protein [Fimbriimonadaceae bacterium]